MFKSGLGKGPALNGSGGYELLNGAERQHGEGIEWQWLHRAPQPVQTAFRTLGMHSGRSVWRNVMPIITVCLSGTLLVLTTMHTLRYIKLSGIYRPAYKAIPVISDSQIAAASTLHLTTDQCLQQYPGLFEEADRSMKYWQQRGGVSMDQIDSAANHGQTARVLIYDGEMYIKRMEWERHSRTRSTLAAIHEAILTSVEPIPNIEFVLQTDDLGDIGVELPIMALDRKAEQNWLWLMPDYGFNSWPEPKVGSYSEVVRKAKAWDAKTSWSEKVPQLFWKGAFLVEVRRKLADMAKGYSWGAIEDVDWRNKNTVMTMDEHCKYKFLGHVEGFSYSGRLKYLLACKSVIVAHEMDYIQHFHHLINSTMYSPHQNMVVVPGQDWKTLPFVMEQLLENDEFSEELAERSQKFWQHYISKPSIECYWRYMFQRWAEVQRFTPELHYEDTPYESFNLIGKTQWDPY